jgi:O-methyltransferase
MQRKTDVFRWRRAIQWPLQQALIGMSHFNFFLVRGLDDGLDTTRFLGARYFSIATDYVRNGVVELICQEIKQNGVPGAVAELGVYQGDFAALLNAHLPDREIHLFDTFKGFDSRDVQIDMQSGGDPLPDFSNTGIATVKNRFPPGANVVFHPGWFPETAREQTDIRFALVSLDTDLYQPILEGLRYFWPKISPGGFILVHDYNHRQFSGTKRAVKDFIQEAPIACCPVPDAGGTVVIGKPLFDAFGPERSESLAPHLATQRPLGSPIPCETNPV